VTAPEHAVHAPAEHAHHGDLAVAATRGERRTAWVVAITFLTMIAELIAGEITGSLALTADGWHMASHAGAMGLALGAYWFARTRAASQRFTFGTGKVYALAGFTSGVLLLLVAGWMAIEAVLRLSESRRPWRTARRSRSPSAGLVDQPGVRDDPRRGSRARSRRRPRARSRARARARR
jgi:Co/Zn/Cd efflux system component